MPKTRWAGTPLWQRFTPQYAREEGDERHLPRVESHTLVDPDEEGDYRHLLSAETRARVAAMENR